MIDFNKGVERLNKFLGSEKKTTILYNDELYMIKFPDPVRSKKNVLSYMNNQYSEHIGCSIFRLCGFVTQETMLGYLRDINGIEKIVVGCKDFTQDGSTLHEFSKLGNQVIVDGQLNTTIENVNTVINKSSLIKDKAGILSKFWDMFVVDTLLANGDRHFDNWGLIKKHGEIGFAPIYDCGSSLSALLDDSDMQRLMKSPVDFKNEEYNIQSCYHMNGKRIFYHEVYKKSPAELAGALMRVYPKIDMPRINAIVDSTPHMSEVRKEYLKKSMALRYTQILTPAYDCL